MSQHYSDETRASDTYHLPDLETWYVGQSGEQCPTCCEASDDGLGTGQQHSTDHNGWYYQVCFPGCLPESEPSGPYATEDEALTAAREEAGGCPHGIPEDQRCDDCPAPELWALRDDTKRYLVSSMVGSIADKAQVSCYCSRDAAETMANRLGLSHFKPYRLTDDEAREWSHGPKTDDESED